MFTNMAKGGFHLPAALEEDQAVEGVQGQVGTQQGLGVEFASDIANEDKSNRHGRLPIVKPNRLMRANLNLAQLVVIPDEGQPHPARRWGIDKLLRRWQALAFQTRTTFAAVGRRWL